jgi:hypothetical protein
MIDPPRDEARAAVQTCRSAGIRPVMITGDHPATALAIGRELGLVDGAGRAVTGVELDALSDDALTADVERIAIYARVTAEHKLRVVRAWQRRGQVVAMTGDGVNDAPAVKAADIGIAMGITGTDVTKEASDMVLTDDNFASIVTAVEEGRGIYDNIQKFIHYLLSCNAGEVLLMLVAAVAGWPPPLAAIQILWLNLVTDGLPALALGLEPPEPDIMQRPPRPPQQPVITRRQGLVIFAHAQARRAAAGWTIHLTEHHVKNATLDVDGMPVSLAARIDRIDHHPESGRWQVLDYKTSARGRLPAQSHRSRDRWTDLQLPLYRHLLSEVPGIGDHALVDVGYFNVPARVEEIGIRIADWTADDYAGADETARHVVRQVRAGIFWPPNNEAARSFPEFDAICQTHAILEDDGGEEES